MAKKPRRPAEPVRKSNHKPSGKDVQTLGQITALADGVVTAASSRKDPAIDIPSRTLSNVRYNKAKRFIEMGNGKNRRELFNLSQAKSYMQTMLVASGARKLIGWVMRKVSREIIAARARCPAVIQKMRVISDLLPSLRSAIRALAGSSGLTSRYSRPTIFS